MIIHNTLEDTAKNEYKPMTILDIVGKCSLEAETTFKCDKIQVLKLQITEKISKTLSPGVSSSKMALKAS